MIAIILTILAAGAIWTFGFTCGVNIGSTMHTCPRHHDGRATLYNIDEDGGI